MTRVLLVASILAIVAGCDKAKEMAGGGKRSKDADVPALPPTNLANRPDIVFQVFGEREDARVVPIAVIAEGRITPITLDELGWRRFDSLYTRTGNTLTLYRGGRPAGTVTIRQGMWEGQEPLYALPGCRSLVPMASVSIQATAPLGYTVELLASTLALGRGAADPPVEPAASERAGAAALAAAAADGGIDAETLRGLDRSYHGIHTGASPRPTVVATALDKEADAGAGRARVAHVFALADADSAGGAYRVTFSHVASGPASTAEYRRYIDHLDLTGDGTDEIILEGWKSEGDTFLVILGRGAAGWSEIFRGRSSWCLDSR